MFSSCALLRPSSQGRTELAKQLKVERNQEISKQLEFLGQEYINYIGKESILNLSNETNKYLKQIYEAITSNNELVFDREMSIKFNIVKDESPFHFSLPNGNIFLSTGLLKKYITNEDLLVAVLSYEIFRSHKSLYETKTVVPNGNIDTVRILSIVRINLEVRSEINKWVYLIMKRAGYDPSALLNLIQIKNKNSLDFAQSVGNISTISREEFNFKNYLTRSAVEASSPLLERSPDVGFYALKKDIIKVR